MKKDFTIYRTINIKAHRSKVWQTLVNPDLIKQYLKGANVSAGWNEGSKIIYAGSFNGIEFEDEGRIDILDFERQFQYSYWSASHGTANTRENHVTVTYFITGKENETKLEVIQTNYQSKEIAEAMNRIWDLVLNNLKAVAEKH